MSNLFTEPKIDIRRINKHKPTAVSQVAIPIKNKPIINKNIELYKPANNTEYKYKQIQTNSLKTNKFNKLFNIKINEKKNNHKINKKKSHQPSNIL